MSRCVYCAADLPDDAILCPHHHCGSSDHWAEANRIMCDLLHRGRIPARLPREQRDEEFWACDQLA